MLKGDLVRVREWRQPDSEWFAVGIIIEYDKLMKIATVLRQDNGVIERCRADSVELLKRAPQNIELLRKKYQNSENNT